MRKPFDVNDLSIRSPRAGDGEGFARAWLDAGDYYVGLDSDAFQMPNAVGLAEWMEEGALKAGSPDVRFFVADVSGAAIGFLVGVVQRPIPNAERQFVREVGQVRLIVDVLVVQRAYWRHGVGTRLMHLAEEWGRERGAESVLLDTYVGSDVSVPFYEQRMGYGRRALRFKKRLV